MTDYQKRKSSAERKVLEKVKRDGGFGIFWATEYASIARAATRLIKLGVIVENGKSRFPWCGYKIKT